MTKSLSVIVPCYNEQAVILETYSRLTTILKQISIVYEIIFINDGSIDNTLPIITDLAAKDKHLKVISFSKNFGHQNAVTAGINHCNCDMAVIIDADLQDPPELIPDLIKSMEDNKAQVVYCVRTERKGESFFKRLSAKLFYKLLNYLSDVKLPLDTGDFRLIDRSVINEFNKLKEKGKYIRGLIFWLGFKQVAFNYQREARFAGETKYPLSKMIKLATTSILYFSKKPLKIASLLGFWSVLISVILGVWSIFGKIFGYTNADSGWTSLFLIIVFFGGIQLLTIGIMGEYIGNLFDEIKERPDYIVERKINF